MSNNIGYGIFNFDVEDGQFFYKAPISGDSFKEKVYFRASWSEPLPEGSKIIVGDTNRGNSAVEFTVIGCHLCAENAYNVTAER